MNILITGAGGFLGSALALRLSRMDHQVSLLIRKNTNLHRLADLSPYEIGSCDTNQEINKFISDCPPDVVIHTACCYGRRGESTLQIIDSNIRFGTVILEALKDLNKRVTFVNTGTVLSREVSLYALTKIQFEELGSCIANASKPNIQFINIKLQHMYGPGDDVSKFSAYVIDALKNNKATLPLTFGEQIRDFVYIDDVVDAYQILLENLDKIDDQCDVELGFGCSVSIREFVETVYRLTNSNTDLLFGKIPYRENDLTSMVANINFLKKLGWSPKFSLEKGIAKIIEMDKFK